MSSAPALPSSTLSVVVADNDVIASAGNVVLNKGVAGNHQVADQAVDVRSGLGLQDHVLVVGIRAEVQGVDAAAVEQSEGDGTIKVPSSQVRKEQCLYVRPDWNRRRTRCRPPVVWGHRKGHAER